MTIPLKYNTASQEVPLGHFLDSGNGDTEETGLTIANTDIKLWKAGGTTLVNKNSGGATHMANGVYYATLDATDTNTYGPLVIFVHVTGALAVKVECTVMEANAYDALYAALGTGSVESNLVQMGASTQSATDLKDFADAGYDPATNKVQGVLLTDTVTTYTGNTPQTGDAYAIVNSGTFGNAQLVRSTTPANTLDVNATGGAGVDWANVDGQSSVVNLSGTTVNLANTTTDVTNAVTVGTINANAINAAAIAAAAITSAKFAAGAIDANALATDAAQEIRDAILPTQNAAFNNIQFLFVAASDHVTPVTGATGMAVTRSVDGGAFASGTGTGPAEIGNGIYQYDASAADMNGGVITFRFTATGGTPGAPDDTFITVVTGGGV